MPKERKGSFARDENMSTCEITGRAKSLALDPAGCRVIQRALRDGDKRAASGLVAELHGSVRQLIASAHGNYVVQAVIEVMPTALASFVSDELKGAGAETARHKYGCRIVCRLVEHSAADTSTIALIDETLQEAKELCRHTYGHHVIESILEHGLPAHKERVVDALSAVLQVIARNKNGTYVIVAALRHGSAVDQARLASSLLTLPLGLLDLAEDKYGMHVVRALLRMTGDHAGIARTVLSQHVVRLQGSPFGSKIVDELGRQV
jgi:hypothetical protein